MSGSAEPIPILYVDDAEELHEPFRIFMESAGSFKVHTCSSSAEALARIAGGEYRAIVSDFQMPGMDGIELLRKLRSGNDTTPFILFTGKGREEVAINAINNGADFYLQKGGDPVSQFAELSHFLKTAVSSREAEIEIAETKDQLSSIFDGSSDAVMLFDREGRVVRVNNAFEQMFGMRRDNVMGAKVPVAGMGKLSAIGRALEDVIARGDSMHREEIRIGSEGKTRYLDVILNPILDRAGRLSFVACSARDISGQVRLHALTKLLHETSNAVLNEAPLAPVLSGVCARLAGIFGFGSVTIFLREEDGTVSLLADDRRPAGEEVDEAAGYLSSAASLAIRAGEISLVKAGDPNFREWKGIAGRNGYDSIVAIPLRFADEVIGSLCVCGNNLDSAYNDIAVPMQNAANALSVAVHSSELREKLKLLETALQNATDTVVLTDRNGIIQWVNRAFTETTGYEAEEVRGKTMRILKSGRHDSDFYTGMWKAILSGETFHAVLTNMRKNGELYFEDTVITPVRGAENVISGFVAIKREIRDR